MLSQGKRQHLQYLYHGGGLPAVIAWALRALLSPLYYREARHIVARKMPEQNPLDSIDEERERTDSECLTVESLEALQAVEGEIPSSITYPLESLRKYLAQGCVIFLVFCPKSSGQERDFVGYGIDRRSVLSVLGREKAAPFDILFGRYREILPEYRGQRYSDVLLLAREEYCRKNGVKLWCGTVSPDNRPSLKSTLARGGYQIVGTAVRVSFLRGRFVWETPWEKIEMALQNFSQRGT
jgi:GNAT superfamily N-acetyltransferase